MTNLARDEMHHARENAKGWFSSIEEMLANLDKDDDSREDAERTIHESILSVLVRNGWHAPGQLPDDGPEEYEILLSTGGPALRIWGQLDEHNHPSSAEMQMQDWGTQWTRYPAPEATLLKFAQCFWFD